MHLSAKTITELKKWSEPATREKTVALFAALGGIENIDGAGLLNEQFIRKAEGHLSELKKILEVAHLMGYEVVEDETEDSMFYSQSLEVLNPAKAIKEAKEKKTGKMKCPVCGKEVDIRLKEANMDKPLKDWTFSDVQEYCKKQRNTSERCSACKIKKFCDKYLGRKGESASPKYWDLSEPPRWTEREVEDAVHLKKILDSRKIGYLTRGRGGELRFCDNYGKSESVFSSISLCPDMFKSLLPGETATLDEIIGGAE